MEKKSFAEFVMEEAEKRGILKSKVLTLMFREEIIPMLDEKINSFHHSNEELTAIHATDVVVEIRDTRTGCIFRRDLPLEVEENGTGIVLKGENLSSEPVEIFFFSQGGAERVDSMMGLGPDEDPCGGHTDHHH